MSQPMKYTPTPWLADGGSRIQGNSDGHRYDIARMCLPSHLSVVDAQGASYLQAEANAAHIVKCVNMHDALVTACKDLDSIKGKIPEFPGSAFLEIARDLARAALAETAEAPA